MGNNSSAAAVLVPVTDPVLAIDGSRCPVCKGGPLVADPTPLGEFARACCRSCGHERTTQ